MAWTLHPKGLTDWSGFAHFQRVPIDARMAVSPLFGCDRGLYDTRDDYALACHVRSDGACIVGT